MITEKLSHNIQAHLLLVIRDWSSQLRQATEISYSV